VPPACVPGIKQLIKNTIVIIQDQDVPIPAVGIAFDLGTGWDGIRSVVALIGVIEFDGNFGLVTGYDIVGDAYGKAVFRRSGS
jgi:hypothetical protein